MDLTAASTVAEVIASLGVLVTLVYIAREFHHNAERSKVDSMAKAIETQVIQFANLAREPAQADLLRRALADFDNLTQNQQGKISAVIHEITLSHNVIRHAYESALLPEQEYKALQHNWVSLIRTKGGRQWWQKWKHMMPDDVIEYVDTALDDPNIKVKPLDEEMPWLFGTQDADS